MSQATKRVVLAGATGWAGGALARGVAAAEDLELVAGVSRSAAGTGLDAHLGAEVGPVPLFADAPAALAHAGAVDVFVEYTQPGIAQQNIEAALGAGAHVVVGTSGLDQGQFAAIDVLARSEGRGVLACGNFALTAVLMMKFSEQAARLLKQVEVIDYSHAGKVDAPSGTARELAHRLAQVGVADPGVPVADIRGEPAARGGSLGVQVHSVRLPSFVLSIESIFGAPDERLTIRHDAGSGAEPYVGGALLAVRKVGELVGLVRGLDQVLDL